jgi:hypothetical protein
VLEDANAESRDNVGSLVDTSVGSLDDNLAARSSGRVVNVGDSLAELETGVGEVLAKERAVLLLKDVLVATIRSARRRFGLVCK